ncbi:MAG: hydroxymethylbilane synthase [Acidimicrobiales bacterium]
MPDRPIRLATRGSQLALTQVDLVATALAAGGGMGAGAAGGGAGAAGGGAGGAAGGGVERVIVQTGGDARRDVPIHAIGGRGVFVAEVDQAVAEGRADASVHSAKDLPSGAGDGSAYGADRLVVAAYLPRADPRDALVGARLDDLAAGARVASGSVRRRAQLAWLRPDLRFEELRGNIGTRLRKIPPGGAIVVAMAALARLGLEDRATHVFSATEMLPQVGQGAIAVCCRADDTALLSRLAAMDDAATRAEVECERAWLACVGGGCDSPVGAFARAGSGGELHLEAMIASLDGHVLVRRAQTGSEPEALGRALAAEMLDRCGGRALLEPHHLKGAAS